MSHVVIDVQNISKKYQITKGYKADTLRDKIMEYVAYPVRALKGTHKTQKKTFWALKKVSFQVMSGEVLGIVGKNGAGKSTLLKILSRITEPTTGKIIMRGKVASLLEVGTGFNPELTGRENIYLNGSIIGMAKKEIDNKLEEIISFSGVGEFIDTPVKRYSSGMYVRLAFAVAAHLDADILLVDEVLAVGDAVFQRKSLGRMTEMAKNGKTVVFVSHNLESVSRLCNRVIYLKSGTPVVDENEINGLSLYLEDSAPESSSFYGPLQDQIKIIKVTINNDKDKKNLLEPTDEIEIKVTGKSLSDMDDCRITIAVYKNETRIFTMHDTPKGEYLKKGKFFSTVIIPPLLLRPGDYYVYVGGYQGDGEKWLYGERLAHFRIKESWSSENEVMNVGMINVKNSGERKQV